MYHGKMTDELKKLYSEYEKKFGHDPGGYEELDYGQKHYRQYIRDIKVAIQTGVELPGLYPEEEGTWP